VKATLIQAPGPAAQAILTTASVVRNDLIIMGGYGRAPVLEVVLGSVVDEVLRTSRRPMLICR
jgi:nucleotide-binding universal stress UspA family protein